MTGQNVERSPINENSVIIYSPSCHTGLELHESEYCKLCQILFLFIYYYFGGGGGG